MSGFQTLFYKEVLRFWKVSLQTIVAPMVTALLYLVIFGPALQEHVHVYPGVPYTHFLIPGLIMMSVLQNAFANSSTSLIQSKLNGNLVFILMAPLGAWEVFGAYVLASVVRGVCVGFSVYLATVWFFPFGFAAPFYIAAFILIGATMLGTLGLIAGIYAEKFDQMMSFQNFLIAPLTLLAGVFYSIHSLPPLWRAASRLNPFFYLIDGFRYGFFGASDLRPMTSLIITSVCCVALAGLAMRLLSRGYKLRN